MKNKIISILILTVSLLSLLTSCQKRQFDRYSTGYFDTYSSLVGYDDSQKEFDAVSDRVFKLLEEYHRLFDIYHEYDGINNLCTVNKLFGGEHKETKVDQKIIDMLLFSKEMYTLTDGRTNIAMGSVLSIWHDYRTAEKDDEKYGQIPSMDELTEAAKHTDINDLIIDEEAGTVYLADPKMSLDVGAIAKGYAVEMIARELEGEGVSGYALNIGGNVRAIGPKGDGSPWITGVENPVTDYERPYVAYLEITNESVVTSGSYQRKYIANGQEYHHIIDKNTLMPADKGLVSVTVVCKSSAMADALSTALFCMTIEEGKSFVNSMDEVEALWVSDDSSIHYSENFGKYKK